MILRFQQSYGFSRSDSSCFSSRWHHRYRSHWPVGRGKAITVCLYSQTNWRLDGEGSTVSVFQGLLKAPSRGQRNHKPVSNSVQFRILHPFFNNILLFNFTSFQIDVFMIYFYQISKLQKNILIPQKQLTLPYPTTQHHQFLIYLSRGSGVCVCVCVSPCLLPWSESVNHSVVSDSLRPHGL